MMIMTSIRPALIFTALIISFTMTGCSDNQSSTSDEKPAMKEIEQVNEKLNIAWSEMVSENQNRMALVPELLAVVKKPYDEEQSAFKQLQEARAEVGKLQLSVETFNDTQELVKYQQAQTNLSSSLATVIEISNRYPALNSDAVFQDLLATIDAQEQKITLARTLYEQRKVEYRSLFVHYQRLQDLAGNIPKIIRNHTHNDESTFTRVTAKKSALDRFDIILEPPASLEKAALYLNAQTEMGIALSRLMELSQHYTELQANAEFVRLQSTLEEIDDRMIAVRNIYEEESKKL